MLFGEGTFSSGLCYINYLGFLPAMFRTRMRIWKHSPRLPWRWSSQGTRRLRTPPRGPTPCISNTLAYSASWRTAFSSHWYTSLSWNSSNRFVVWLTLLVFSVFHLFVWCWWIDGILVTLRSVAPELFLKDGILPVISVCYISVCDKHYSGLSILFSVHFVCLKSA